ncbi:hypothetical protein FRC10_002376 [Ceratobasidium sp. 414]|nr:hypothetical protein FRC10_002376 [Ceratobasidium sp. 414]
MDKGNTHTPVKSGSTCISVEQVIDIDGDEDEKPSIPPSPVDIKQESSYAGEGQYGDDLASMIRLLAREVRQGNALARQTNERLDRLVRALERNTGSH